MRTASRPRGAASFAMTMLVQTSRGDAYTEAELGAMFGRAGFSRTEFHPLPPTRQELAISLPLASGRRDLPTVNERAVRRPPEGGRPGRLHLGRRR